jgi:hypothetical protein
MTHYKFLDVIITLYPNISLTNTTVYKLALEYEKITLNIIALEYKKITLNILN